ncbi:GreA/GreB family elongation factor [Neobacillus sp. MM2021_6]|uniref:GreA/GreB family elongation factor n=1 Tax=Bacillaceae TaxID=186817 RepID=UPI0014080787|nr:MULTISPECIES: GreA/GreB family elongation factor [Bacillaceae]MBO0962923.1 GreA/GreB family elongation factor [Neobacillus sp. MM2021_6]NHC19998.1 GreA/GreB family elongation factor [Bacillus sp. MM2020_4]
MNHRNQTREFYAQQLVYLDENIKDLTNLYLSSTPIQERIKHFFNLYVLEVEELLSKASKKGPPSVFPKVFIGTKVTVLFEEDQETEDFVICLPEQSNPDSGFISFLSPVGRQLLLRKHGEQLSLKIPTGDLQVTIRNISFVGDLFEMEGQYKEA